MGKPVSMFEVTSPEPDRAKRFYSRLFDWKVNEVPHGGGYALIETSDDPSALGGGIGPSTGEGDTGIKIYVQVDDLDAYLEKATQLGGSRIVEPTELPEGFGSFAVFADPDGNHVGLWA